MGRGKEKKEQTETEVHRKGKKNIQTNRKEAETD